MGYRGRDAQTNVKNLVSKGMKALREQMRRLLWYDWRTKLFALLFALSLWFFLLSEHIV